MVTRNDKRVTCHLPGLGATASRCSAWGIATGPFRKT
jgi:hypothetical protein